MEYMILMVTYIYMVMDVLIKQQPSILVAMMPTV